MSRLLVLACSATKTSTPGSVPAIERYNGPLWQTLRVVDPTGSLAHASVLSARLGWLHGSEFVENYEQRLTAERAREIADAGLLHHPSQPGKVKGIQRTTACYWLSQLSKVEPITEVCIVGGHLYRDLGLELLRQAQVAREQYGRTYQFIQPDARIVTICDQIGYMRQALRAWLLSSNLQQVA